MHDWRVGRALRLGLAQTGMGASTMGSLLYVRFTLIYMFLCNVFQVSAMLRDIINTQNAQITFMRSYLTENDADLVAEVCENDDDGDHDVPGYAIGIIAVLAVLCLVFLATLLVKAHGARKQKQQQEQGQKGKQSAVKSADTTGIATTT